MKELYSLLLSLKVVVLVGGKLVVVASVDCKIVGDKIIVMRAVTTGTILGIQYWFVLQSCHLLLKVIVLTPALVLSTTVNMEDDLA